jgi:hypothetical protein
MWHSEHDQTGHVSFVFEQNAGRILVDVYEGEK